MCPCTFLIWFYAWVHSLILTCCFEYQVQMLLHHSLAEFQWPPSLPLWHQNRTTYIYTMCVCINIYISSLLRLIPYLLHDQNKHGNDDDAIKNISNKAVRITVHTWGVLIESGESNVAQLLWSLSDPWNLTQPPCNWIQSHLLPSVQQELIY